MLGFRPQKNARLERYTLHGPTSSICIWPEQRRIVYAGNFEAQLPGVIRRCIAEDHRHAVNSERMSYLMNLACEATDSEA
ncbi:hypothetical protein IB286_11585 [Spongiibacter sp. KMU-158]|uniref:Uncharacterized protein n=1 Tax=Spongiibacter pelagi TaxID=2760804 RepID=A0A927C4X3_9GAMM|nr:hypothetical protein [Spongiibacter pelagi]MBD2859646.1 hypothetical protein [Spongiibacter pelagi]